MPDYLLVDLSDCSAFRGSAEDVAKHLKVELPEKEPSAEDEDFDALLQRACMRKISDIVYATNNSGRVHIGGYTENNWADCLTIRFFIEEGARRKTWQVLHLSPARARVIAKLLLDRAEYLEKNDPGMKCIDGFD